MAAKSETRSVKMLDHHTFVQMPFHLWTTHKDPAKPEGHSRHESTASAGQASIYSTNSTLSTKSSRLLVFQRRSVKHGLSNTRALINLTKGLVGTGVLSMAAGYANSGIWVGPILTVIIIAISLHCLALVVDLSHHYCGISGKHTLDYADVAEYACLYGPDKFTKYSGVVRTVVNSFIMVTQLGFCCAYCAFVPQNIKQVVDYLHPEEKVDIHVYVAVFIIPVTALVMIRKLKHIAPVALFANLLFVVAFVITFQYLFQSIPSISERPAFNSISTLPLFFGTVMFAFEAVGMILPIENKMNDPAAMIGWNGVLNTAGGMTCMLYIAVGFFGYLKFGDAALTAGTITLNLPHDILYQIVRIMFAVAIYFTYALQFYVPVDIMRNWLEQRYRNEKKKAIIYEYIGRIAMVVLTFAAAEAIPHVDLFISLIGSLTCSALGLIIPCILDSVSHFGVSREFGRTTGKWHWKAWKNGIIITIGVVGMVSGTYSSIVQMAHTF